MLAINIEDLKDFTYKLFSENLFDSYYVTNIEISTFNNFFIDAKINQGYFENESKEYSYWKDLKPLCFNLIKGKILPLRFKIILKLDKTALSEFIKLNKLEKYSNILKECFINVSYENKILNITSGLFISEFSLDKSPEKAWDEYIINMFNKENIKYNIL